MKNDILFYDSTCPICDHEIAKLKRNCEAGIDFRDIHALSDEDFMQFPSPQPTRTRLLEKLHCLTYDKGWLIGAEANLRAWEHTPFKNWIKPLSWPGILNLVKGAYEIWLIYYRYQRQQRLTCTDCKREKS